MSIIITAVTTYATTTTTTASRFFLIPIRCSDSNPKRGFGTKTNGSNKNSKRNKAATSKEQKSMMLQQRNSTTKQSEAPGLSSRFGGKSSNISLDLEFEERLKAVKRSALEQKKADEKKEFRAIDYDAPIKSDNKTIGFGTKIGVGVAVVLFGLVFALGDFLPSGSVSPTEDAATVNSKLSEEEKVILQTRLKEYEVTLSNSPKDAAALEGAAVTLAELGEYTHAASLLEDLKKENPNDPDVFSLLGEVKYKLKDYGGSADAYKTASMVSPYLNFEVLRGHTNALLAAKEPEEAVQVLLASKERLSKENLDVRTERTSKETDPKKVDPVQVDLLLGKAYSDWGHIGDAVSVYDQLISSHPNDFRGYLAKGIILKENGKLGDAERMFIQARFFAPDGAKRLVDRYAK